MSTKRLRHDKRDGCSVGAAGAAIYGGASIMKAMVIHLSDMHFREGTNSVMEKAPAIARAVENRAARCDFVLLLLSGDVSWSGKESEMLVAMEFLEDLRKQLKTGPGIGIETVMVPGNHDVDLSIGGGIRVALVKAISGEGPTAVSDDVVAQCVQAQNSFFMLRDCFHNESAIISQNRLTSVHSYLVGCYDDRRRREVCR